MENASKAILIAGAVLIVLAVISVAILFFGKANKITNPFLKDVTEQKIINHNNIFSIYDGEITGTQVISLVTKAANNNDNAKNISINVIVSGKSILGGSTSINEIINSIVKTKIYFGIIIYNSEGYIERIIVN